MHQHAAQSVMTKAAALVAPAIDGLRKPDIAGAFALVDELGRVLDQQNRPVGAAEAIPRGGEVAAQDFAFLDAIIGEKSIGRLRARPVLACIGDTLAHAIANLPDQL